MKNWTLVASLALLAACGAQSELQTAPSSSVVGDTTLLTLPVGTSASAGEITVGFNSVAEDSRCPTGVQCVWEGDAEVVLTLGGPAGIESVRLHTTLDPRVVDFGGYEVELRAVAPYPVDGEAIEPDDYVVQLAVVDTR